MLIGSNFVTYVFISITNDIAINDNNNKLIIYLCIDYIMTPLHFLLSILIIW